jgi:cysteine-rich repeat protein
MRFKAPSLPPFVSAVLAVFTASMVAACGGDDTGGTPGTARCGNATVEAGEQCDDGNTTSGDGCSSTCQSEGSASCGNGAVDPGEACDDGNKTSGDGCSSACQSEAAGACGNGTVDPGEQCDDGNVTSGDGCDASCKKPPAEVVCKTLPALPAGATGTCAVTAGSASTLLQGTILTPGTVYRGGSVLVDDKGLIACVGCDCEASAAGATTVSCPDGVISPALINTHDHITYAQNSPYTDTGERYEHRHDWRVGNNGHKKLTTPGGATADQVRWAELRFLMGGAASTVGSGSVAGLLRNLDRAADEMGLNQPAVDFETFPLGDSKGVELASGCAYPTIRTPASITATDAFLPHVAEGINTAARNEFLCLSSAANGGQDVLAAKTSMIHSIGLTASDYAAIGSEGGSVIWSPRSNITLYGDTAIVTEAARLGAHIALGTDWVATGSMNLLRELQCADSMNTKYFGRFFSDEELWRMVTVDAAHATATDDVLGTLAKGKVADVTIFAGKTHKDFRAVIDASVADVALVMRGGKVLYGDEAIIATVPAAGACDTFDVCGTSKKVCLASEIGKDLTALKAAVGTIYPAFFCGVPTSEPSCVPARPAAVDGSTIYTGVPSATDGDGDGVPTATDNCPTVFNPVRPMDKGKQADADGDGVGDACDLCPLDANKTNCAKADPNDSDHDGIPNATDNCPDKTNADQADGDGDKKGDVCDACPAVANPGNQACPASIYDIKSGAVAVGTAVSLTNQLVTARYASGFFLQVKPGDPGYVAPENSGVFVFDGANTVKAGDRVSIATALVANFFGEIELTGPATTVVTSAAEAAPPPVVVTPADVATGGAKAAALEGVLVQVANVSVTDVAPAPGTSDTAPTNEFVVDGSLRVNDLLYLVAPFPAVGSTYTSLTGVLDLRNGNTKLEPRTAADVVAGPAQLTAFNVPSSFTRVGATAVPTLPTPLAVKLTSAVTADTVVAIASSDPASLTVVGGGVTVLAGQSTANVLVNGLAQAASVTLTASYSGKTATAAVRVVAGTEVPKLTSLAPAIVDLLAGKSATLTVTLDLPAAAGGTAVAVSVSPANAGTLPATVTVPADQTSATFTYADGSVVSGAVITATLGADSKTATVNVRTSLGGLVINEVDYDVVGTDNAEFVELYNGTSASIDLSGYSLYLINGSNSLVYKTIDLGAAGSLDAGQYLVIGATSVVSTVPATAKTIDLGALQDILQNGSPDGIALVNTTTSKLVDALSYEGAMTAVTLPGVGTVSLVEGTLLPATVADSNTVQGSMCRLPNGTDTNDAASDWKIASTPTPGTANVP